MDKIDWSLVCIFKYGNQLKHLTTRLVITSVVVSWVCVILRLIDRRNDTFPARVATQAAIIGALYSVNVLIGPIVNYDQIDGLKTYHDLCIVQGVIFQFLALSLVACWNFICVLTYQVVVRHVPSRKLMQQEFYFHVISWPLILLFTFLPIFNSGINVYGPDSGISSCYLESVDDQISYLYGFMAITLLLGLGMSIQIFSRLYALVKSAHRSQPSDDTPSRRTSLFTFSFFRSTDEEDSPSTPTQSTAITMGYHLIRHILFLVIFAFVFVTVLLDSLNRRLDKHAHSEDEALNDRFPKNHPCGTTFVSTATTSGIGLFVGVVFFRWPKGAVDAASQKLRLFSSQDPLPNEYLGMVDEESDDDCTAP